MIKYALRCAGGHTFEAWFRSSDDFTRQSEGGHVACPSCADTRIEKDVMAPAVVASRQTRAAKPSAHDGAGPATYAQATAALMELAKQVREHLESHGEYVGDRFAEEARARHDATPKDDAGQGPESMESSPESSHASPANKPASQQENQGSPATPATDKPLWGTATLREARELLDDGIAIMPLPPGPKDHN